MLPNHAFIVLLRFAALQKIKSKIVWIKHNSIEIEANSGSNKPKKSKSNPSGFISAFSGLSQRRKRKLRKKSSCVGICIQCCCHPNVQNLMRNLGFHSECNWISDTLH